MADLTNETTNVYDNGRDLEHLKLRMFYVSSITDLDTVTTGIPGIVKVMTRSHGPVGSGELSALIATNNVFISAVSSAPTTKRVQGYLSNAATGQITLECTAGASATTVLVWSRG